eukprot:m51a1_g5981 putative cysteate synthase (445) ;mRNA; r:250916-252377
MSTCTHHFVLKCRACGREYPGDEHAWRLACDSEPAHGPALLYTVYTPAPAPASAQHPLGSLDRYAHLLPCASAFLPPSSKAPVAFRAEALGRAIGLDNLWLSFCGYWPEHGATMGTCTFKELEASSVHARLAGMNAAGAESERRTLVVASAGNTARAFSQTFSRSGAPLVVVVPEASVESLWSPEPFSDSVRLIAVVGDGADYSDAIRVADIIAKMPGFLPEGGARNVARRDGMGVATLAAIDALGGKAPGHYFQAVGSGTGGVAAWEAAQRFEGSQKPMALHLVQNAPFAPMHDAWLAGSRALLKADEEESRRRIAQVSAIVLTNRNPPYAIAGGVYDALKESNGHTHVATNEEAAEAAKLFEQTEGIDVDPAAAVALAALVKAARQGAIPKGDVVLCNVTGGGKKRLFADVRAKGGKIQQLAPFATIDRKAISEENVRKIFS